MFKYRTEEETQKKYIATLLRPPGKAWTGVLPTVNNPSCPTLPRYQTVNSLHLQVDSLHYMVNSPLLLYVKHNCVNPLEIPCHCSHDLHKAVSEIRGLTLMPHMPWHNQGKILKIQPVSLTGTSIQEQGAPLTSILLTESCNSGSGQWAVEDVHMGLYKRGCIKGVVQKGLYKRVFSKGVVFSSIYNRWGGKDGVVYLRSRNLVCSKNRVVVNLGFSQERCCGNGRTSEKMYLLSFSSSLIPPR